ncbi:MAG TPA: hypothetical protein VM389_05820 [Phycisphaerae bacterium]|nr:hypothetical protein [Phycisphaerae bacterium]HUU22037.1 hypothetical protein [Phycisphaerae bacterium]
MHRTGILCAVLLIGAWPLAARADLDLDIYPIGDPIQGNSWSHNVSVSGANTYDLLAARMVTPGATFEDPYFTNIGASGWSVVLGTPVVASMGGPQSAGGWTFQIHFPDDPGARSFVFDFAGFKDGSEDPYRFSRWEWNGSSWKVYATNSSPYWVPTRSEVVPAPGAVLLGAIGLGVVGWWRRHRAAA